MVKLRLTRTGKKNYKTYRVVAIHDREKRDSRPIEILGWYDPNIKEGKKYKLETERIKYWLSVGAQPSDTVNFLLTKDGLVKKAKHVKKFNTQPGKKAQERAEAKAAKAQAEAKPAETPAE